MERSDSSNSAAKTRQNEIRQILAILHKWGIHTIGQLAALDKQQLGARLGPEAIRMWERANGQSSRVIKLIRPAKEQFGLFEATLRNPHQLSETLARLTALLGADRVGTPVLEETHRPDAFRIEPFTWHGLPAHLIGRMPMPRPALRRFRPPAATSMFVSKQRHLQSETIRGQVVDQRGPYLFSGSWWDEKSWVCTEWDLQLEAGELVLAHESQGSWKLDGIYD